MSTFFNGSVNGGISTPSVNTNTSQVAGTTNLAGTINVVGTLNVIGSTSLNNGVNVTSDSNGYPLVGFYNASPVSQPTTSNGVTSVSQLQGAGNATALSNLVFDTYQALLKLGLIARA
jgi:hypothetical protein